MKNQIFKALAIIILLISCTSSNRMVSTYQFPDNKWHRFTNPEVKFQIDKPGIYYDMYMELEYDAEKQYEDFKITVIMYTPGGEMRSRDIMTDFNASEVRGKEAAFRVVLRREYAFSEQGECTFEIENRSSKLNFPGMKSLSIILERSQDS